MVSGWSYLAGSSGVPASFISCTSAFPREVTRSETCTGLSPQSGCGGSAVTGPCQVPARVFNVSNDFCASDGALLSLDLCASDCAKAMMANNTKTADNIKREDFMFNSPSGGLTCWFTPGLELFARAINFDRRALEVDILL